MTATPPRADLRTLAAEALWAGVGTVMSLEGLTDAVLAAVLPEHRRMVLEEAADRLDPGPRDHGRIEDEMTSADWVKAAQRGAAANLRMWAWAPAAAAPPAGPSVPVSAEPAPVVPEEADGQRAAEGDALHAPDDVYRLVAADRAARWDYVHTLPPEDLAAYIRTQSLDRNLREDADTVWWAARSRYGNQRDRALAAHEEEFERANRLAAQVAQFRRVVEAAKAWRGNRYASASILELAAAVDALHEAEPHQHECACNRNWGGPCGPCVCEEPPRQGVWRLTCGAGNIPPNQTYATKGAAEDVMRLHDGACPGAHGVEFVPDAGTDQTEGDRG